MGAVSGLACRVSSFSSCYIIEKQKKVAKFLEMRTYRWESILKLDNKSAKMKRALMQFTPSSWKKIDWFEKENPLTRCLALLFLMIMWQIAGE